MRTLGVVPDGTWNYLVDDRHVQRVGSGDPPAADRTVELPGTTILPGFVDAHVHLTSTGLALGEASVEERADPGTSSWRSPEGGPPPTGRRWCS